MARLTTAGAAYLGLWMLVCTGCGRPAAPSGDGPSVEVRPSANSPVNSAESPVVNSAAQPRGPEKIAAQHLPNAYRVHAKVISGGQPEGEAAFRELQQLGINTIISVDGAKPQLALAQQFGLRYVHLPHGYDGISTDQVAQLAKAVRDLDGPIYLHCHHGKHRSPTAAAVACVGAGLLEPSQAIAILQAAGTSPNYRGLYQAAQSAQRIDDLELDKLPGDFPAEVQLPPLAEAMVAIEQTHDRLKQVAAAGWQAPAHHPDVEPAHEALLLLEHFTELLRTDTVQKEPAAFQASLQGSAEASRLLEAALRQTTAQPAAEPTPDPAATAADLTARRSQLDPLLARISEQCLSCHRQFRDVPLGEKQ